MPIRSWTCVLTLVVSLAATEGRLDAATITVSAGGNLQAAIDAASPGDTILLQAGAEYVGNFVLRAKSGTAYITIRSSTPNSLLPGPGQRIRPEHAPLLARIRSANDISAILTDPGAHHWRLQYLDFPANWNGYSEIIRLGDGSSAQNSLSLVPHHFILDHLYVHGDPLLGQKRGIAINVGHLELRDSHVSDIKAVAQDAQAVCGWNGPGPFTIENNYLEAAGENLIFTGSPYILNMVPSDIVIRGNLISRPMSWKDPIVGTPNSVSASAASGGSLAAGTYAYKVVARRSVGQGNMGRSTASAEATATLGAAGAIRIQWAAVPTATEYRVYGRTAGGQAMYWRVTGTEFVDTGAAGTAEAVPTTAGTVWTVKNLFELKAGRNVLVEKNILENHWKQAQPGYAIVYTPRSSGGCYWCTVENVTFQYNLVRNVSAGVNILAYDDTAPTQQANTLIFRQNLFSGMRKALGGNAYFMQIGDGPHDIVLDHNTVDSDGNVFVYVYGGTSTDPTEVFGFQMTNNAGRHGLYGIHGTYFAWGNQVLNMYYPGGIFQANYLAGAPASRYPAGTLVTGLFEDQFVNVAAGDYTVRTSSMLQGAATDGADVGVDVAALTAALTGVSTGSTLPLPPANQSPTADFSFTCDGLTCSFSDESGDADGSIASWSWAFGDGTSSTAQSPAQTFAAGGTYSVTLTVTDNLGASASVSTTVTVKPPNVRPVAAFTFTCTNLACSFTNTSTDSDGTIAGWTWSFGDGSSSTAQNPAHGFASGGSYSVSLTVTDDEGASATVTKAVTVKAPNVAPVAAFTYSCTNLACSFTSTSADSDGTIASWSWGFGDGSSATGATATRTFAAAGTYNVTLTVSDNEAATASVTNAVTVTVAVAPNVHIGNLSGVSILQSTSWSARVTITVHSADEKPVSGAEVRYHWTWGTFFTCTTDTTGRCTADSPATPLSTMSLKMTVSSITSSVGAYKPSANHDLDGGSNGTAIRVHK